MPRSILVLKTGVLILALAVLVGCNADDSRIVYNSEDGYVPDQRTAIAITEAIGTTFYGEGRIAKERPFTATFANGVWTVKGTLHGGQHAVGGTLEVQISKQDGRILKMTHGQ